MHGTLSTIGFDADDTLWQNEQFFRLTEARFTQILQEFAEENLLRERLLEAISEILAAGREMLSHPVETLPQVRETLEDLSGSFRLVMITKGDLFDQERKLAQSGLGELFNGVEIVSDKTPDTYRRVFARHGDGAERAMMVGNSLKSDVAPAIEAGSWGVYVPHDLTWVLERIDPPEDHPRYRQIDHLGELRSLIAKLA
jgi:putative hydrolase of the HAD superfamily